MNLCKSSKQAILTAIYSRDKLRSANQIYGNISQRTAEKDCTPCDLKYATLISGAIEYTVIHLRSAV